MGEKIRVILFQETDMWVAQGLERDICVQAANLEDARDRFELVARLEADEEGGLARIDKAPEHFFELWDGKAGAYVPRRDPNSDHFSFGLAA